MDLIKQQCLPIFLVRLMNQLERQSLMVRVMKRQLRKSAKQIKKNEDDIITNPEVLSMEDNSINEYYLKQYKNICLRKT